VPKFDNGGNFAKGLTLNFLGIRNAIGNVLPVAKMLHIKAWLWGSKYTNIAQRHITNVPARGKPIPFLVKRINSSRLSMISLIFNFNPKIFNDFYKQNNQWGQNSNLLPTNIITHVIASKFYKKPLIKLNA